MQVALAKRIFRPKSNPKFTLKKKHIRVKVIRES